MKRRLYSLLLTGTALALLLLFMAWANGTLSSYYVRILHFWGIYIIFGLTFQLVYGYTGQLSLGHAGLIAIGGYTTAILTLDPQTKAVSYLLAPPIWPISVVQWPFLPALLLGGVLTAIVGFLVAAPALRLRGDYLAMVTLGFAEVIRLVFVNLPSVVNGSMGLRGIPLFSTLPLTWICVMVTVFVLQRLVNSSFGRAFKAVSEDEIASEALGINLFRHKVLAFVISSFFAGIGGGLMAGVLGTIDPNTFRMPLTNIAITIVVLGGMRSITGCILASGIYTITSELLRAVETPRVIWGIDLPGIPGLRVEFFGLLLLVIILYMRRGMLDSKEFSWKWLVDQIKKLTGRRDKPIAQPVKHGG